MAMMKKMIARPISPPGKTIWASSAEEASAVSMRFSFRHALRGPPRGVPLNRRRFSRPPDVRWSDGRRRACNARANGGEPCVSAASGVICTEDYDANVSLKWDFSTLADRLGEILSHAEADLRLEQAVYGLDAKDELTLHALLAQGLRRFYEVAREAHYPSTVGRKLTHRQRCDLVLSSKGRPLRLDSAPPSLFDPPDLCDPRDALWLEVKVAYQFREGGVRHGGY